MPGSGALELVWNELPQRGWQALSAQAGKSALQQGWAYGEALRAGGGDVRRAVAYARDGRPAALAQIVRRRLLDGFGTAFLLRGPVWLDETARAAHEPALLDALRRSLPRTALVWMPERAGPLARLHGRWPVMSAYSTAWLGLGRELAEIRAGLHGKWRNALVRAETAGLEVDNCRGGSLVTWFLRENERHRRKAGYQGPRPAFLRTLVQAAEEARELLLLIAREGAEPMAGVLVVIHGGAATYELGYTSPRGRELRAHHLLLWRAVERLSARGARWLDLGGVATDTAPGIARFKLGMGGEVATLAGTWLLPPHWRG